MSWPRRVPACRAIRRSFRTTPFGRVAIRSPTATCGAARRTATSGLSPAQTASARSCGFSSGTTPPSARTTGRSAACYRSSPFALTFSRSPPTIAWRSSSASSPPTRTSSRCIPAGSAIRSSAACGRSSAASPSPPSGGCYRRRRRTGSCRRSASGVFRPFLSFASGVPSSSRLTRRPAPIRRPRGLLDVLLKRLWLSVPPDVSVQTPDLPSRTSVVFAPRYDRALLSGPADVAAVAAVFLEGPGASGIVPVVGVPSLAVLDRVTGGPSWLSILGPALSTRAVLTPARARPWGASSACSRPRPRSTAAISSRAASLGFAAAPRSSRTVAPGLSSVSGCPSGRLAVPVTRCRRVRRPGARPS